MRPQSNINALSIHNTDLYNGYPFQAQWVKVNSGASSDFKWTEQVDIERTICNHCQCVQSVLMRQKP